MQIKNPIRAYFGVIKSPNIEYNVDKKGSAGLMILIYVAF